MTMVAGRVASFFMILLMVVVLGGSARLAKKKMVDVAWPAGLRAIDKAVKHAAEQGRPIHYSPGTGSITTADAPQVFASLSILGLVGRLAAKAGCKVICTVRFAEVLPLAQEALSKAYTQESRSDLYAEDSVRYLSQAQFAYAAGTIATMEREKIAANFLIGPFIGEALILAETGAKINAVQVAGTALLGNLPFFVAACDYTMIGDEVYAAGAIASEDPAQIATIRGQDMIKALMFVALVVGLVLKVTGVYNVDQLLRM